jgi:hypothetical protein
MAYYQTNYGYDDPETERRMRALAGLDPDELAPAPAPLVPEQPPAPALASELAPELVEPALRGRALEPTFSSPLEALANRGQPQPAPERPLTAEERQADRNAIDAEGEAKFGGALNDLSVIAALVGDIAGNKGQGIGKLGMGWAQGKMQAADRDRALAQRNREIAGARAQHQADQEAARAQHQADQEGIETRDLRHVTSGERMHALGEEAQDGRSQRTIEAENERQGRQLTSAEARDAAHLAEQARMNTASISNMETDNTEQNRHGLELERQGRSQMWLTDQFRRDQAKWRQEDKDQARTDKEEQRNLLSSPIPGIETHDQRAADAAMTNAAMREKAIEARSVIGAAADAMNDMVDIRTKIGVGDIQKDAKDINRFQQAQARFVGGLGAMSGMGGVLSDKEREKLEGMAASVTFGGRDALDAMASLAGYGDPNQDTQLEKLKGALEDVKNRVNVRLAPIGGHYVRMKTNYDEPPDPAAPPKPGAAIKWKPGTFAPNAGGY